MIQESSLTYTDAANTLLKLADQISIKMHHYYLGTEHLLLAFVRLHSCSTVPLWERLGVSPSQIEKSVLKRVQPGPFQLGMAVCKVAKTPRAYSVLKIAKQESAEMGCSQVDVHHILLGLAMEREGVASVSLAENFLTEEKIKAAIIPLWYKNSAPTEPPLEFDFINKPVIKTTPTEEKCMPFQGFQGTLQVKAPVKVHYPTDAYLALVHNLVQLKVTPDLAARVALDVFRLTLNQPKIEESQ